MKRAEPAAPGGRRSLLIAVARGLLVAVAFLPFTPLFVRGSPALAALASPLNAWFRFQCQQDPARTLRVLGHALPVCARCSGLYFGLGLGALVARPRLRARQLRVWLLAASALMLLDVFSEALGWRPAWAPLRVLSGLLLSYPVGAALIDGARARHYRSLDSETVFHAE